jgi:hypothetical protein
MTQQTYSEQEVDFGQRQTLHWNWSGDNSTVPTGQVLEVATITLNYFPTSPGVIGRVDVTGQASSSSVAWKIPVVYVEPRKTKHLTFPKGLLLETGGHVEVGFTNDGPGTIFVSLNGTLSTATAAA